MPRVLALVLAAALAVAAALGRPAPAGAQALTPFRPTFPRCGGAGGPLPTSDANGNALYVHVVDSAGYDFEIWCMRGVWSRYYEFRASFPDGTVQKVDECELDMGLNDVVLQLAGDTTGSSALPNGGTKITVGGTIVKYYHENRNSSYDFHTIYDYATKRLVRIDTRHAVDDSGKPYRRILAAAALAPTDPATRFGRSGSAGGAEPSPFAEAMACAPGTFAPAERVRDTVLEVATSRRVRRGIEIFYPATTPIAALRFEGRDNTLRLTLAPAPRPAYASIAISRGFLDRGAGLSRVTVDGAAVEAEETITATFRALTFPVAAGAREAAIVGRTRRVPATTLALALLGGLVVLLSAILAIVVMGRRRGRSSASA